MAKATTIEAGAWVGYMDGSVLFEGTVEEVRGDRATVRITRRAGLDAAGQYNLMSLPAARLTRFA